MASSDFAESKRKEYEDGGVHLTYDEKRFSGPGGEYVDSEERAVLIGMLSGSRGLFLDLACGPGRAFMAVRSGERQVIGADYSTKMLSIAKKNGVSPLVRCDAFKLPFRDKSFDGVSCLRFMFHYEDYGLIAREVSRVLKDGGVFVFDARQPWSLRWLLSVLSDRGRGEGKKIWFAGSRDVKKKIREAGFEVAEVREKFALPLQAYGRLGRLYFFGAIADRIIPRFMRVSSFFKAVKKK